MTETFLKLMKDHKQQIQESQRFLSRAFKKYTYLDILYLNC